MHSYNRELIKSISAELGIAEDKVPSLVDKIAELVKPKVSEFVGRRTLMAAGAGGLLALATASPAMGKMTITDQHMDIDGVKLSPKQYEDMFSSPPVASAVVEIPDWDSDHIYAWKPANNYKGWKLIDRGEVGVDDASVIQAAINSVDRGVVFIKSGTYYINNEILLKSNVRVVGEGIAATILKPIIDTYVFSENPDNTSLSNVVIETLRDRLSEHRKRNPS